MSSRYQPPELETETTLPPGISMRPEQKDILLRILKMIHKIKETEKELFEGIATSKLLKSILQVTNETSRNWEKVPDEILLRRVRRVLAVERMSELLKELTAEEIRSFEDAVKRRPLF
jgi:hypothetical protein